LTPSHPPDTFLGMTLPPRVFTAALALLLVLAGGCERGFPTAEDRPTVAEDTFVAAMAELRHAEILAPDGLVPPETRERILTGLGTTADEIAAFAEVHGADVSYMFGVWTRVDSALVEKASELEDDPSAETPGDEALEPAAPPALP
jgi:hypothetical protein